MIILHPLFDKRYLLRLISSHAAFLTTEMCLQPSNHQLYTAGSDGVLMISDVLMSSSTAYATDNLAKGRYVDM